MISRTWPLGPSQYSASRRKLAPWQGLGALAAWAAGGLAAGGLALRLRDA